MNSLSTTCMFLLYYSAALAAREVNKLIKLIIIIAHVFRLLFQIGPGDQITWPETRDQITWGVQYFKRPYVEFST